MSYTDVYSIIKQENNETLTESEKNAIEKYKPYIQNFLLIIY